MKKKLDLDEFMIRGILKDFAEGIGTQLTDSFEIRRYEHEQEKAIKKLLMFYKMGTKGI